MGVEAAEAAADAVVAGGGVPGGLSCLWVRKVGRCWAQLEGINYWLGGGGGGRGGGDGKGSGEQRFEAA
jgi:hypothetical protein